MREYLFNPLKLCEVCLMTCLWSIYANTLRAIERLKSICIIQFWGVHLCVSVYACMCAKSLQSCPALCEPMDCSPPGSSVHGILQARMLEWVATRSSRVSSQPRDRICISLHLLHWQVCSLPLATLGKTCVCVCVCVREREREVMKQVPTWWNRCPCETGSLPTSAPKSWQHLSEMLQIHFSSRTGPSDTVFLRVYPPKASTALQRRNIPKEPIAHWQVCNSKCESKSSLPK